jgi:drug/metabolite transporter (DMT)-like permease
VSSLGILSGLATAVLWALTAVCFESAGRRIGSLSVNILRLVVAAILFIALSMARTGHPLPPGLSTSAWLHLSLSGLIGFVVGDLMLFRAFVLIGARLSMLIYACVPAMTAAAGFWFFGERIAGRALVGMGITVAGILAAIGSKRAGEAGQQGDSGREGRRRLGIALAFGGAAGQAAGLLLAKHGARGIDSFAATEVRVLTALVGFFVLAWMATRLRELTALLGRAWASPSDREAIAESRLLRRALVLLSVGALLGPFLGVSLGLLSTQLLPVGVACTLMSLVPVLLIPISALALRERAAVSEIAGTAVAFAGVAVMAL